VKTQDTGQHEVQMMDGILRNIIGSLHTNVEGSGSIAVNHVAGKVSGILSSDPCREVLLAAALNRGALWPLSLITVPLDDDFIYLAYRVIVGREPDQEGFSHFQSALSMGAMSRASILSALLSSPEVQSNNTPIIGKKMIVLLHEASRICGKIPLVNRVIRAVWTMSTGQKRMRRITLLLQEMREEMQGMREEMDEYKLKSDDTIEYFSNLGTRKLQRVGLNSDRSVANGKHT